MEKAEIYEEIFKKAEGVLREHGIDFLRINRQDVQQIIGEAGNVKEVHVFLTCPRDQEITEEQRQKIILAPIAKQERNQFMPCHVECYTMILKDQPDTRYRWQAFLSWEYRDPNAQPSGIYEIWTRNELKKGDLIILRNGSYYITCNPIKKTGESLTEECRIGTFLRER